MRVRNWLSALVLGAALSMAPGCSVFQSACDKALPSLVQGQALAHEAEAALEDAQAAINESALSEKAKANANEAIAKARIGLQASSKSLALASTACSQPAIAQVFEAFIFAWDKVREFLALVGDGGTRPVADPTVYTMAR